MEQLQPDRLPAHNTKPGQKLLFGFVELTIELVLDIRNLQILIIFLLSQVKIYYCFIFLNNFTHLRRDREQKSIYQNKTNYLARQFLNPAKRFDISSS